MDSNKAKSFSEQLDAVGEFGIVLEVLHPLVLIEGLSGAHLHEIVMFESGEYGEIFILQEDTAQILVFSNKPIQAGCRVTRTGTFVSVPVGKELLGTTIDPLGVYVQAKEGTKTPAEKRRIDVPPLGIPERVRIGTSMLTGVSVVDIMIPLGKGQKELIIGDRKTGKTSFVLSAIMTQVKSGSVAIYAAIGKRKSDIRRIDEFFKASGISDSTIIVASESDDSPSLIFQTPYSAMTIAEYFRDQGVDTLLVLDDLSTHARFYREVSLLAKRFPGRESYPGDIFFTHGRLLERTGNFKHKTKEEVSITTLPIAELVEGDFAGYIPTNLMGMTDGHIYFDSDVFFQGRRPAVNISLSVTRVGKQATSSVVRSINRELTAFLALYEKMQNLSHFGAELTPTVKHVLETGQMIYTFFEQPYTLNLPQPVELVFFSMLWLKFFDIQSKGNLAEYRANFMKAYESQSAVKNMVDASVQVKTFNELLASVSKERDSLISLCTTQTKSLQK